MSSKTLIIILGDQLTPSISALSGISPSDTVILMCEVMKEASYVHHHKKKIAFIFSSMRHFADELREAGWLVDYVKLDDSDNTGSFHGEILRALKRHGANQIRMTEPGEWRVLNEIKQLPVQPIIVADDRFLCSHDKFHAWAKGRKVLRMEYFYREMRQKTGLLMDNDKPVGGQWNFDHENRKRPKANLSLLQPLQFSPDAETSAVINLVATHFSHHFGDLEPFWFPVTRADAERSAEHFVSHSLPNFGDYQDAMLIKEKFLYHSILSPLINVGLLNPLALCRMAETAYQKGHAPLNAVEGFIRQIIGWREYVRGIYWLQGPDYVHRNELGAKRSLPAMYWTAETNMACMAAVIQQTKEEAYAHHIQRLMVTGNFALLAGINPHEVHEWYLAVYADAYEWVEAPNTIGMSQFADGGLLASKPYVSSGAYIDRMSDYCGNCHYQVKEKTGARACPFNSLYWDFLARHRTRFETNPRMAQMYRTYDKMTEEYRHALHTQAQNFLYHIDKSGTDK